MWTDKVSKNHHVLKLYVLALLWVNLGSQNYVGGLPAPMEATLTDANRMLHNERVDIGKDAEIGANRT